MRECAAVRSLKREPDKEAEAGWFVLKWIRWKTWKPPCRRIELGKGINPKGFEIMLKKGQIPEFTAELMKQELKFTESGGSSYDGNEVLK